MSQTIDNIIYSDDMKTVEGVENKEITSAVIKEGVTTIGEYAFSSCENLQSVVIPSSVTTIGKKAFSGCKIENYEHTLFKIKNGCCLSSDEKTVIYCTNGSKEKIVIPEGVTTIRDFAFNGCKNLQSVVISEGVITIGEGAFYRCKNLQSVEIPESVSMIEEYTFSYCENLKEVHFGGNIEKLSGRLFDDSPNVELYAPEKSLTEKAIKKNAKLKKLYKKLEQAKQAKITEIKAAGTEGFLRAYCGGIGKEQKIEKVEKNIEVTIFTNELSSENESKYAKITVPEKTAQKKLSEIQTAFDEVRSEGESVTVEKLLETIKKNVESFEWEIYNDEKDRTIYLLKILTDEPYKYSEFKNVIISKKVKEIKSYAFDSCTNLQNVEIQEGITAIGNYAFKSTNLQNIVIPSSVTTIGESAFIWCKNLQNVTISKGVTTIGESAFSDCENLQNVTIPESVISIRKSTFSGCKNLQNVIIPEGVTTIGEYAFSSCKNLQSVVIPSSVTTIGKKAFSGCKIENYEHTLFKIKNGCCLSSDEKTVLYCSNSSKQEIVIPEGVTTIGEGVTPTGDGVFSRRENLQNVTIPESVTLIGGSTFYGCKNLQNVTIPEGVTSIGRYAFGECKNLQTVIIPDSVTSIGPYVFKNCPNLTVTFDGTKEEWEKIEGVEDCRAKNVKFNK